MSRQPNYNANEDHMATKDDHTLKALQGATGDLLQLIAHWSLHSTTQRHIDAIPHLHEALEELAPDYLDDGQGYRAGGDDD